MIDGSRPACTSALGAHQHKFDHSTANTTISGTGTADTGKDMAQYDLVKGKEYTLEFYPREDGVALDAW